MYDNLRDVEFRLRGTLVEFSGELRYVKAVDKEEDKFKLRLSTKGWVDLSDSRLKITNIRVGYMNIGGHLVYLSRKPTRTYRQGLRSDNTSCKGDIGFRDLQHLVEQGVKPSRFVEGYKILSRDYAVRDDKLFYKERLVGIYYDGQPYLNNDKSFLSESLGECHVL